MNHGVYDSKIQDTILFYIQIPENADGENIKLKAVDINLSFLPIYGIHIKRLICENKNVDIDEEANKIHINELYQGTTIYVVIEINETKHRDSIIAFDDTRIAIDINYFDVEENKNTNLLLNSTITSQNNDYFETLINEIKQGNRPRIKPCSNTLYLYDSDSSEDYEMYNYD